MPNPWRETAALSSWWNQHNLQGSCKAMDIISWIHFYNFVIYPYWCHDCDRIVPVTVQVWDCLSSPMRATLGPNRAPVMDPLERPVLVSQVVVSRRAKELSWFWLMLSMLEYPSAECKSVEFHPCDSRVGKLVVICGADTFPFIIFEFSSVVTLFIFVEFSYLSFSEFIPCWFLWFQIIHWSSLVVSTCWVWFTVLTPAPFIFLDADDANLSTWGRIRCWRSRLDQGGTRLRKQTF
jgi:hypothetical protein